MSFFMNDKIPRIHTLELLVMYTQLDILLTGLKTKDESKIDVELYATYKVAYDQIINNNKIHIEESFENHLEKILTEFKFEINQRRKN